MYIHQQPAWTHFTWNAPTTSKLLVALHQKQGRLAGRMGSLGFSLRKEAVLQTLILGVIKSNEIAQEVLNTEQVRTSNAARAMRKYLSKVVFYLTTYRNSIEVKIDL